MKSKHLPFFLTVTAIFFIIISPNMFSDGMFMDGLIYSVISRNLAQGLGSFWQLFFSETLFAHFHEHPPLMFGIQSLFFKIFGDSILTERFYSLANFLITGWIIVEIWKTITPKTIKHIGWLPLFFWVIIPLVAWAAPNNMLEGSMMIFTSLATLFIIKSYQSKQYINLILSGSFVFLAFLTKGFVGLFPLSLPFWIFLIKPEIKIKRFFTDTIILNISVIISLTIVILLFSESKNSLLAYINEQVINSINNTKTVSTRFFIILRLLKELLPIGVLVGLALVFLRKKKAENINYDWVIILTLLGLSGVAPIMISLKQSGFYILPTFPIFSIAFALIIAPKLQTIITNIEISNLKFRIFKTVSIILFICSITIMAYAGTKVGRNKDMISDVKNIINILPANSTISIEQQLGSNWSLYGYLYRIGHISVDAKNLNLEYYLTKKETTDDKLNNYEKLPLNLKEYNLYKKK